MKKYRFDHEKLDVYQLELQFIAWVTPLIEEVKASAGSKVREVCNHLDRASLSALLYRIVSMLSKLINRFAAATAVREKVVPYNSDEAIEDEYEDEREDD
jgi:formate dehydrogenase maturation protein FdhE